MDKVWSAFVIMPFKPDFNAIYEKLIKVTLVEEGYEVSRADSSTDLKNILDDIVQGIAAADLIIADLTEINANVFYELGIAHGLDVPTLPICQSIDKLPFDLKTYRALEYSTHFEKVDDFVQKLRGYARQRKNGQLGFESPVTPIIKQRLAALKEHPYTPKLEIQVSGLAQKYPTSLTSRSMQITYAGLQTFEPSILIGLILTEISNQIATMGDSVTKHRAENMPNPNDPIDEISIGKYKDTLKLVSDDLMVFCNNTNELTQDLKTNIDRIIDAFANVLLVLDPTFPGEKLAVEIYLMIFDGLLKALPTAINQISDLQTSLEKLPVGILPELDNARKSTIQLISQLIMALERLDGFMRRTTHTIRGIYPDKDS